MNASLAIRFDKGQISLVPEERVEGFLAVCQSALMNLLTDSQTDLIYADRGTDLFRTAVGGGVYDIRTASHACNFAASETLFFSRENETADARDKLESVQLTPAFVGFQRLEARLGFQSVDGRTASYTLPTT